MASNVNDVIGSLTPDQERAWDLNKAAVEARRKALPPRDDWRNICTGKSSLKAYDYRP